MATGGDIFSYSIGSKDFNGIVCDPCQEDGELQKAVGMCIDCQDHLCQKCFDAHKIVRAYRTHKLLDKEAMLQSQISIIKDTCTEKCDVHEDEVIEYYCINHSHLGCSVCKTEVHRTCDRVRYIPHVAKDLANNEEYQQVKSQLMSAVGRSKKVTEDNNQKTKLLERTCSAAVKKVQEFRKGINKVLDKAEADLLLQCEIIKADKTLKFVHILDTLKTTQQKLDNFMKEKDRIKNSKQNCNLYTLMMKQKNTLKSAEDEIKEAEKQQLHINDQIKFIANKATLITMKIPETLGQLLISGTSSTAIPEQPDIPVRQEEQTTSITSGTSSTARPKQTESNGKQEQQTTSITSGTPSTARPEQTESNVRQEEQTTSITSGTPSTARPEQTESNVRQEEQTTSITSGTPSTARPEQTESNVRQEEQTTSITSGTPSTARPEQTESNVRQEEQATSITSGTSSTARPEQTESNVRYQEQGTSIFATSSNYGPEQHKPPVRQKEQISSMRKAGTKRIARAEYIKDISVYHNINFFPNHISFNYEDKKQTIKLTGLVVLSDKRLVTTDFLDNKTVKLVDVKHDKVINCLRLSPGTFDVAMVTNCQVAITIPRDQKVVMVNVTATAMTVDRTLDMDGECYGVDYRDGKLAVSFRAPHKVQVLTLQGRVLHTITTGQQGQELFNYPLYVAFGQDNTSLFVSNNISHNVVNVKFDGTVVGTYTDSELSYPRALLIDNSGHVYVCGLGNIHHITPDCRKVQVLLTEADGLDYPGSISYSETDCRLYVGMIWRDLIKVYRVILASE